MSPSDLYRDIILDHWRNPRNSHSLEHPTHEQSFANASCGDHAFAQVIVDDKGLITHVNLQVSGCALSTASASVLSEFIIGKPVSDIQTMSETDIRLLLGDIEPVVARTNCITLGLQALQQIQ